MEDRSLLCIDMGFDPRPHDLDVFLGPSADGRYRVKYNPKENTTEVLEASGTFRQLRKILREKGGYRIAITQNTANKEFLNKLDRLNRHARMNHGTGAIDYVREHVQAVSSDNCVVHNPSPWRSLDEI